MRTNSAFRRALHFAACLASLTLVPVNAAVVLAEVDLYHSAFVAGGTLDVENPAPTPATGNQNWLGSASSLGTGTVASFGNYNSSVGSDTFEFSGNAEVAMTEAAAGGNGVAAGALRVDFTVPVASTAFLYAVANISTSDGYAFSNPLTRLILTEDGSEIALLELFASGSLDDTVALTPGKLYSFTASIETSISPGATGNLLTSAFSGGSGLAVTPVPEPTGAVLALISGVALTLRRRRERPSCEQPSLRAQVAFPARRRHAPKPSLACFIGAVTLLVSLPLSASPTHSLLKDINLNPYEESSSPTSFLTIGNTTYFVASSNIHGKELWKTDATTGGTMLVKDTYPGTGNGTVSTLANLGGNLIFIADDGVHGREIWRSNGTEAGTYMIKEITPGDGPGSFSKGAVLNGFFYFPADDGAHGTELWKTDGTSAGTVMVADVNAGSESGSPSEIVAMGSNIYFTAYHPSYGTELWKSNGTAAGTTLLKDIRPGTGNSSIDEMTVVGSTLYFSAVSSSSTGRNLWKSDGTTTGTVLVKDLDPASSTDRLYQITPVGSMIYFNGRTSANGDELWKSSGTAAGTVLVKDLRTGSPGGLYQQPLHVLGSTVFFYGTDGSQYGLWKSDGTSSGTTFLASTGTIPATSTVIGSTLYLQMGVELWKTNGTPASTVEVLDGLIELQSGVVSIGSTILFAASQPFGTPGSVMTELWKSDGSIGNHELVKNIRTRTSDSNPNGLVVADGRVFFEASDGIHGQELWSSDGTEEGTTLTRDIRPGSSGIGLLSKFAVGGEVYFPADDGSHGVELWRSDGTETGTTMVADIQSGPPSSMDASRAPIGALGNLVLFGADDGVHGTELWITDGTAANTLLLKDINPGSGGSNVGLRPGVHMNGILYFHASTDASGMELWRTDGTSAGTYMVVEIGAGTQSGINGSYSSYPNGIALDGQMYFSANDGGSGFELWKTDGTASGTSLVRDIHPSGSSFDTSFRMYAHDGIVYFHANNGSSGRELWRSDGTNGGTYMLKDIEPGAMGSATNILTAGSFNGKLLFLASDSAHGTEIWQTDGTVTGTTVIDIKSGPESAVYIYNISGPPIAIRPDEVYFTGSDGELWRTDGTVSGSQAIIDEHLYAVSSPLYLSTINDRMIFSAAYPHLGRESAVYVFPTPEIEIESPVGTSLVAGVSAVDFGTVPQGAPAVMRTIRVRNIGDLVLESVAATITDTAAGEFSIVPPGLPASLEPGEFADIQVSFQPAASGFRSALLQIGSNDADENPFEITLAGQRLARPSFTSTPLSVDTRGTDVDLIVNPTTGRISVSYLPLAFPKEVRVATRIGNSWSTSTAYTTPGTALSPNGVDLQLAARYSDIALALRDQNNNSIVVCEASSSTWTSSTVVSGGASDWSSPYLTYAAGGARDLLYYKAGGTLYYHHGSTTVTFGGTLSLPTPIAVDPTTGRPTFVHVKDAAGNLYIQRRGSSLTSWTGQLIQLANSSGWFTGLGSSLAYGSDGKPRVSFVHEQSKELRFATYDGSSWSIEVVGVLPKANFNTRTKLLQGPDGVWYCASVTDDAAFSQKDLRLWRNAGGVWTSQLIASAGSEDFGMDQDNAQLWLAYSLPSATNNLSVVSAIFPSAATADLDLRGSTGAPFPANGGVLDFGGVASGAEKQATLLVENTGGALLSDLSISLDGIALASGFELTGLPPAGASLLPGASLTFGCRFVAGTASASGSLVLTSANGGDITVQLAATTQSAGLLASSAFGAAGLTGDDALPDAIPFNDGVENLLKYAFNMNLAGPDVSVMPAGSGTGGLPAVGLHETAEGTVLRVEFVRRKGSGLVYSPRTSSNLQNFENMTETPMITDIDDDWERVRVEHPCDPATTPRCFVVVEVLAP